MTSPNEVSARLDLSDSPQPSRAARRAIRVILRSWGYRSSSWLDTADLVVSELVANAVRHGGGCLALDLWTHARQVVVGVWDRSTRLPHHRGLTADTVEDGGRGMLLIEGLGCRWGVHRRPDGKRVWALLPSHP